MATFEVVSIDAWRDPEGGWFWNNQHRCGEIEIEPDAISKPRKLLSVLRKAGILTSASAGRVRVDYSGSDPETIEIQNKSTCEPLVAITVDWAEIKAGGPGMDPNYKPCYASAEYVSKRPDSDDL